jgi:chemotaxis protein CheD
MGQMRVDSDGQNLHTLLGSCVGLALYDRKARVGGLAHIVLPQSRGKTDQPGKFVDTAIPTLIHQLEQLAGQKLSLISKIAGGASMFAANSSARIGEQNVDACLRLLRELRIPILAEDCGGEKGRRMTLDTNNGNVIIEIAGQDPIELK